MGGGGGGQGQPRATGEAGAKGMRGRAVCLAGTLCYFVCCEPGTGYFRRRLLNMSAEQFTPVDECMWPDLWSRTVCVISCGLAKAKAHLVTLRDPC